MAQPAQVLTQNAREKFLKILRSTCNVSEAARQVGISRRRVYQVREDDPVFCEAWDDAISEAIDTLEGEVYRRACGGVDRPVFQGGECVGHVREYSDRLAEILLRGHLPRRYQNITRIEVPPALPQSHRFVPTEEDQRKVLDEFRGNGHDTEPEALH